MLQMQLSLMYFSGGGKIYIIHHSFMLHVTRNIDTLSTYSSFDA